MGNQEKREGLFVLLLKSAWGVLSTLYYWAWGVLSGFKKTCDGFCPPITKWTWGLCPWGVLSVYLFKKGCPYDDGNQASFYPVASYLYCMKNYSSQMFRHFMMNVFRCKYFIVISFLCHQQVES